MAVSGSASCPYYLRTRASREDAWVPAHRLRGDMFRGHDGGGDGPLFRRYVVRPPPEEPLQLLWPSAALRSGSVFDLRTRKQTWWPERRHGRKTWMAGLRQPSRGRPGRRVNLNGVWYHTAIIDQSARPSRLPSGTTVVEPPLRWLSCLRGGRIAVHRENPDLLRRTRGAGSALRHP